MPDIDRDTFECAQFSHTRKLDTLENMTAKSEKKNGHTRKFGHTRKMGTLESEIPLIIVLAVNSRTESQQEN